MVKFYYDLEHEIGIFYQCPDCGVEALPSSFDLHHDGIHYICPRCWHSVLVLVNSYFPYEPQ